MKILITGSGGMLGKDLVAALEHYHELVPLTRAEADITNADQIRNAIRQVRPNVVIHAAAMTAVDDCELRPELAFKVNSEGTRNVASACAEIGAAMLYVSTDYVFDGEKIGAYIESDPVHPVSVYGASKLEGERHVAALVPKHWIVRTSWVFGASGKNFIEAILKAATVAPVYDRRPAAVAPVSPPALTAGKGPAVLDDPLLCQGREEIAATAQLRVVDDQRGCPTYTRDLAAKIRQIAGQASPGIYHVSNQGACSRFEFAQEILRQAGLDPAIIEPIPTTESDRPARRPKNSELANTRLITEGLGLLPDWKDALRRYLQEKPPAR